MERNPVEAVASESSHGWYYGSFADESGFLGGLIMEANGVLSFSMLAGMRGINPGGQLLCFPIPDEVLPGEKYRNRLLKIEEIQEFWPESGSLKDLEAENA